MELQTLNCEKLLNCRHGKNKRATRNCTNGYTKYREKGHRRRERERERRESKSMCTMATSHSTSIASENITSLIHLLATPLLHHHISTSTSIYTLVHRHTAVCVPHPYTNATIHRESMLYAIERKERKITHNKLCVWFCVVYTVCIKLLTNIRRTRTVFLPLCAPYTNCDVGWLAG